MIEAVALILYFSQILSQHSFEVVNLVSNGLSSGWMFVRNNFLSITVFLNPVIILIKLGLGEDGIFFSGWVSQHMERGFGNLSLNNGPQSS